jgi:hypothetical protein
MFYHEDASNYNSWRDEALTQALVIEAKSILKNKKLVCPDGMNNDDVQIWEIKRKVLFDILLTALKPAIRQVIKGRINEDEKNAAELWSALETEYRMHAADVRLDLVRKFTTISMDSYNKNVQAYISDFRDICGKLKNMKFDIPTWMKNDKFIDGLRTHQGEFERMKRDEVRL